MTEHHVGTAGGGDVGECRQVALAGVDGDAGLASPAVERGQRIGAGIDDGDPVAEPGDAYGRGAGAAADVEDVERAGDEDRVERIPDGDGPRACPTTG